MNFTDAAMFLSPLDVGILLLAVLGAWVGMKVGAVSTLFNTLGGLLGSWAASRFYSSALSVFHSAFLAYFIVFFLVAFTCVTAGVILSQLWENYFLGLSDRFLGAMLGILLSLTLVAVGLIPALMNDVPSARRLLRGSSFAPYLVRVTQKYFSLTSQSLWVTIDPYLESDRVRRVREILDKAR